ncbi:carboxypeptidase Y-deficient [Yamadazyma tenuis]|uniref:FYVE-type domain-containing protein n=1 Tax=Candida tenuis (strain ATCC 10573 / BCRC 21748 / CBS 615 / JCM 9827 / NBRC 10315 / NRRL Y-1498 / VKM Y-70) TaxID=590646 RepID=G3BFN0_CANTC|nr:uncharacterized protein CANTEDRAFT_136559 [Yamadazyma tenuis ATCC 10573]EGV60057.1 hypothetical protein CANTEDRAFT_136559 [Yamadazyma tenuis ATCC 10573]WEJ94713.1 carboxypeptidase Y-deficient [Yamadazyma tenuis]
MTAKTKRRVLGTVQQAPTTANGSTKLPIQSGEHPLPVPQPVMTSPSPIAHTGPDSLICPICNEKMISVNQLNQHIDDVHLGDSNSDSPPPPTAMPTTPQKLDSPGVLDKIIKRNTTPTKKIINLDLFEGSKTFSLSDSNGRDANSMSPTLHQKPRVSRTHWVQPSGNNTCSMAGCSKQLNVKNGIVNCRRCGKLFCNSHTDFKVKLRNPNPGESIPQYDKDGIWSKCCEECFFHKPDIVAGTAVNAVDLTSSFRQLRQTRQEENQLIIDKTVKKFIKLVNLLTEFYITSQHHREAPRTGLSSFFQTSTLDESLLIEKQREIVGYENWQDQNLVQYCYICLTKFGFLLRKHHCRLCGQVVCDDKFSERQECSLLVPLPMILSKLTHLNYSVQVKTHFDEVLHSHDDLFSVRMCKNCKDSLLYDYKLKILNEQHDPKLQELFSYYNQLFVVKEKIHHQMAKYRREMDAVTKSKSNAALESTNRFKDRVMGSFREFERILTEFKTIYFVQNSVSPQFQKYGRILKGINQSLILFLQESLMEFKDLNNRLKQTENEAMPKQPEVEIPRLTKKQIRELRESLMVMNEQKFIIEKLINDVTKQRKFDELQPLLNNKLEITTEIDRLESELGEFGFS